ncbi:MAG: hypothetical protein Q8S84_01865 [bacterium]|nr:hypothetical protein [bacterium]
MFSVFVPIFLFSDTSGNSIIRAIYRIIVLHHAKVPIINSNLIHKGSISNFSPIQ